MRCNDSDIKTLKDITDDLMKKDKKEKGGTLTIKDDLEEVTGKGPVQKMGITTYERPAGNATEEVKKKWNELIKQILGQ